MTTRRRVLGASTALVGGLAVFVVTGCGGTTEAAGVAANDIGDTSPIAATQAPPQAVSEPTPAPTAQAAPAAAKQDAIVNVNCPFRLVDDPYPGRCRRYIDRNENGFCDYSQPA